MWETESHLGGVLDSRRWLMGAIVWKVSLGALSTASTATAAHAACTPHTVPVSCWKKEEQTKIGQRKRTIGEILSLKKKHTPFLHIGQQMGERFFALQPLNSSKVSLDKGNVKEHKEKLRRTSVN